MARKDLQEGIEALDAVPMAIKRALEATRSDEEMVDVIGAYKEMERRAKPIIRAAVVETVPAEKGIIQGNKHRVEVQRKYDRSFNTPRLMTLLQGNGATLMDLIEHGVVELKWRWTELKRFTERRGIELTIVDHEVTPLGEDDGDVGEIASTTYPRWS